MSYFICTTIYYVTSHHSFLYIHALALSLSTIFIQLHLWLLYCVCLLIHVYIFLFKFRFLKLALKTVAVFMVCWIPYATCSLYKAITETCGNGKVESVLFTLAFLNSVINSFIYFSHVQNAVSKQLLKLYCCSFLAKRNTRSTKYQIKATSTLGVTTTTLDG